MKRIFFLLISLIMSAFILTSCNSNTESNTETETALPPTNGDETRYNLNPADTVVNSIDSNAVDSSIHY